MAALLLQSSLSIMTLARLAHSPQLTLLTHTLEPLFSQVKQPAKLLISRLQHGTSMLRVLSLMY